MVVLVDVLCEGPARPAIGATVYVNISDTALADVESPVVGEGRAEVVGARSSWLATVECDVEPESVHRSSRLTVFAHVDVDGDGRISPGDFITTQSFPVELASGVQTRVQVSVVKI
jgi:hypothetical protein